VNDARVTTAELLEAWREATRAADLAARLARQAEEAADHADDDAMGSEEIARLAESAAEAAEVASAKARTAADRASTLAASKRDAGVGDARETEDAARVFETEAREEYHDAEAEARRRHATEETTSKR
jgi:hypothetical protein